MRCNSETRPPWEHIATALTGGQKWTRTAGADWSSGRRWARAGDGSPGSREAEGEGGDGFYIAQSGRCPDLLVSRGVVDAVKEKAMFDIQASRSSPSLSLRNRQQKMEINHWRTYRQTEGNLRIENRSPFCAAPARH
jgi:hypothetical protein